jgi:hypothetical protein
VGDYQLKVRPYFFKNEKGTLLLVASNDSVRKLQAFSQQSVTSMRLSLHQSFSDLSFRQKPDSADTRAGVIAREIQV